MVDGPAGPELPAEVVERLQSELGEKAERIVRCLQTAAALVDQAKTDDRHLRLAESAAYNIREALNSVVEGQDAADGGLRAVIDAWRTFKAEVAQPNADIAAARESLDEVLGITEADESRSSYHARQLLAYLRDRAGVNPLSRRGDPVEEYGDLRNRANAAVHTELGLTDVISLLSQTVAWIVRVFTPPDAAAEAIRSLARQQWQDQGQISELETLFTNDHQLRLFFSEITDPAWLEPLHSAGVAKLPSAGSPWPVAALLNGLGQTSPRSVAHLLELLLVDTRSQPKDQRASLRFELLWAASQLGQAGHAVVAEVAPQHGDLSGVRALSVAVAEEADPADPVVLQVADSVLNYYHHFTDGDTYYATTLLNQIQSGVTKENVANRAQMLAGKTRQQARSPHARFATLGIQALIVDPDEYPEPILLLAHHLVRLLLKARLYGVPTSVQSDWLGDIEGEVGERIRSQSLAGADDVTLADKIAHIAHRLSSSTAPATGDDAELVADITSHNPAPEDLADWTTSLGRPSAPPTGSEDRIPADWARVWWWSAVLPGDVLTDWQESIDYVTGYYGEPDPGAFIHDRTTVQSGFLGRSPYSTDQLTSMPVLEAATMVATWRPDTREPRIFGTSELAGALEETVKNDPQSWSINSEAVVIALQQPIYIEHFLRALTEKAADILPRADAVIAAITRARRLQEDRGAPTELGLPTAESDQTSIELAALDLVRTLADQDADIVARLDSLWEWALLASRYPPGTAHDLLFPDRDPLYSALSQPWTRALHTVLALAAWEYRHRGTARPEFEGALDLAISAPGSIGLEYRAILARQRPLLETIARPWLDTHAAALFRDGTLARKTFDLTLRWARPTIWIYQNFKAELFDAALRGADNATRQIASAALRKIDGYDVDTVVQKLRVKASILGSAAESVAFLVQNSDPGSPNLSIAVNFWNRLLDANPPVPVEALLSLGRWSFVKNLDDDQWAYLTLRTLQATSGRIDNPISVSDRAAAIPASNTSRQILLQMLDNGKPWERYRAAQKSLDVLRASAAQPADDSFWRLRTRLVDLGYHEALAITSDGDE